MPTPTIRTAVNASTFMPAYDAVARAWLVEAVLAAPRREGERVRAARRPEVRLDLVLEELELAARLFDLVLEDVLGRAGVETRREVVGRHAQSAVGTLTAEIRGPHEALIAPRGAS